MLRKLSLALIAVAISVMVYVGYCYQQFISVPLNNTTAINYTVKVGSNLKQISDDLTNQKLTPLPSIYLQIYGRYTGLSYKIKAGEYKIIPGTTLPDFLKKIVSGKTLMHAFTIVEGMTIKQLLTALDADIKIKKTFYSSQQLMTQLGEPKQKAEGWFMPETYFFPSGTSDFSFLNRAHKAMKTELTQLWNKRAADLPYKTPYDALIMASLIEKETAAPEERAEIAGVFVRRLKIGMRLQTDPTVIYGMKDHYHGNITRKDLRTDTPYNTYTRYGLPPTPICMPGKASIEAALHPKSGNSLYFVATGKDGKHYFSATLKQHNAAVRKYQLHQK